MYILLYLNLATDPMPKARKFSIRLERLVQIQDQLLSRNSEDNGYYSNIKNKVSLMLSCVDQYAVICFTDMQ